MISNRVWNWSGILLLGVATGCAAAEEEKASAMSVSSPVIQEGGMVPPEHTCEGRAFPVPAMGNPELTWTAGPKGTLSYAIVVKHLAISENTPQTDPAFARGFMWAIWDIPATVTTLPANLGSAQMPPAVPGAQQWASFNQFGFFAPCPNFMNFEAKAMGTEMRVVDDYGFVVYAMPTATIALPPRPSDVTNYTMTLALFFDANAIGSAQLNAKSDALPISFTPPDTAALVFPAGVTTTTNMFPPMPSATAPAASTAAPAATP
jgi:phosphatidylethanolamine-binding protein (PEBP) family uncharacterized protein